MRWRPCWASALLADPHTTHTWLHALHVCLPWLHTYAVWLSQLYLWHMLLALQLSLRQHPAQELLPADPKERDISRAQEKMTACMDACANEYAGKVPKLKADVAAGLSKLGK